MGDFSCSGNVRGKNAYEVGGKNVGSVDAVIFVLLASGA